MEYIDSLLNGKQLIIISYLLGATTCIFHFLVTAFIDRINMIYSTIIYAIILLSGLYLMLVIS